MVFPVLMNFGGLRHIICSSLYLKKRYLLLVIEVEEIVIHEEVLQSENTVLQTRMEFKVKLKPCRYMWAPWIYGNDPSRVMV